jgi:hypothetical protein
MDFVPMVGRFGVFAAAMLAVYSERFLRILLFLLQEMSFLFWWLLELL